MLLFVLDVVMVRTPMYSMGLAYRIFPGSRADVCVHILRPWTSPDDFAGPVFPGDACSGMIGAVHTAADAVKLDRWHREANRNKCADRRFCPLDFPG